MQKAIIQIIEQESIRTAIITLIISFIFGYIFMFLLNKFVDN